MNNLQTKIEEQLINADGVSRQVDLLVMPKPRGYYGIGIENTKTEMNIGTLWRSAKIFNASFIFTIGNRYKKQASDTLKAYRHIPLYQYDSFNKFYEAMPYDCKLKKIAVEYKDGWIILLKQGDITISYPKTDVKQFIEDLSRALNGERLSTLH